MVGRLHERGLQGIRICPQISNSGVHWIAWITSSQHVLPNHGAMLHPTAMMQAMQSAPKSALAACYTSAQETMYFGWKDASGDSSDQLADKFADRFPEICVEAKQSDLGYVEWYRSMLDDTQPEGLPSICASSPETNPLAKGKLVVLGHSNTESIQLPPLPRTGY